MKIYEEGSEFEIGKAVVLRDGRDASVIASGYCVAQALKAAEELEREGGLHTCYRYVYLEAGR